jgi:O-methyltransferase
MQKQGPPSQCRSRSDASHQRDLFLSLLKKTLLNLIYRDPPLGPGEPAGIFDLSNRREGRDWPRDAHTMIGVYRLDNLQACCETAICDAVPGDFVECGVWRGGASILMRGVLAAHDISDRRVVLIDSFRGLPPPNPALFPADEGDCLHTVKELAVSVATVRDTFARYDLLDDQVMFVEGWFKDTLALAPVEQIAVLRLDGDMYESTWQALTALYPKLSVGGFAIIDDFGAISACKAAVLDYRREFNIDESMVEIDWTGVYWRRER